MNKTFESEARLGDAGRIDRLLVPLGGMWRVPFLGAFMPEVNNLVWPFIGGKFDAVAGWGKKPTSVKPRALAKKKGVPFIALEDGFLRSYGLGVDKAPPLSLVLDRTGIYYDSTSPCDLETMLENDAFSEELLARAKSAIQWIRQEKLSKYNKGLVAYKGKPFKYLVIDQTSGDASVSLSGASEDAFEQMITDALALGGGAGSVAVKLHPDTLKGKKGGYLRELAQKHGVMFIDTPVNPWDLFAVVDEVFTISSQMGFEALMAGKKVRCYGMPFYAGWGLTQDLLTCNRRTKKRSIEEIFAAAYIRYARYVDPFTGLPSTLEDTIGLLSDIVRHEKKTAQPSVAVGFSLWRRNFTPHFAGRDVSYRRKVVSKNPACRVIIWSSRHDRLKKSGRLSADTPVTYMEDGFVRSKGLGAKLARPWSLVLDDRGIYYNPQKESDLEHILQNAEMPSGLLLRAAHIREMLVARGVSKYNTGKDNLPDVKNDGRRVILVPGQVEDDASIQTGTQGVCTNFDLLKSVRAKNPDACVIYKPHPDIEAGKRKGKIPPEEARLHSDYIADNCSITALWPIVDEVHTMTSLSGFEALLRDKEVHCYGLPFYAGWGLTTDLSSTPRRTRKLTLDHLVAGTLCLYPLYFDWTTRQPCNVETVIRRLSKA